MTAIVILAERQRGLARAIQNALGGEILGPSRPGDAMRSAFGDGRTVVAIASVGIVARTLAPLLSNKTAEPPVLAVSEDATFIVPVSGGHRGGNDLASSLAKTLNAVAVITTASDRQFGLALDEPPAHYRLGAKVDHKSIATRLLNGAALKPTTPLPDWLSQSELHFDDAGEVTLAVDHRKRDEDLVYHPQCLALGIGCERGVEASAMRDFVHQTLDAHGLALASVAGVYSIDLKQDEKAIHELANDLNVPARFFTANQLDSKRDQLVNPSEQVFRDVGVYGVSEAAALSVGSDLILPKVKGERMTLAVALCDDPIDGAAFGIPQGRLDIVGLGPGDPDYLAPAALDALNACEVAIGYGLYLDLAGIGIDDPRRQDYRLGAEIDRCRAALEAAVEGRRVALICSGDPGIYAMAALVMELIEAHEAFGRVDWQVVPGISAMQLLSARIGAPLGHDFCAISLSDLLTPRHVIEQRLKAAAEGDFVVAFYNPVSKTRREAFEIARQTLLKHRSDDTPVVLGRNLGRSDETVTVMDLDSVRTDDIDMLTTVIVGNSQSRKLQLRSKRNIVFTPRGYASKGSVGDASKTTGNHS